jgi:hypothetical protein
VLSVECQIQLLIELATAAAAGCSSIALLAMTVHYIATWALHELDLLLQAWHPLLQMGTQRMMIDGCCQAQCVQHAAWMCEQLNSLFAAARRAAKVWEYDGCCSEHGQQHNIFQGMTQGVVELTGATTERQCTGN